MIKDFMKKHFSFAFYPTTWIALFFAIIIAPSVMYLPKPFGYENGFFENIQLLVLLIGFIGALKSKTNKKFFVFVALVLGILFIREINCGRTIFFPIPGKVNAFYSWKDIPYGYLAHPIYGVYIAATVIYFFWNKLYKTLWNFIKNVPFPTWDMILMIAGMVLGMYAEKCMEHMVFEETAELLFYSALTGIIYLYAYHKNFKIEE